MTPPAVRHATLIAVDPGDVHVGVAFFTTEAINPWHQLPVDRAEWRCSDAQEWTPDEFADGLAELMLEGGLDTLVIEKFRLYADKAKEQTGSEFPTAQLIGVLKYLVRINNLHAERHRTVEVAGGGLLSCEQRGGICQDGTKIRHVKLVIQPADIKKPTQGVLRHLGVKSVAKQIGAGGHCVDAELHGWHYLLEKSKNREQG